MTSYFDNDDNFRRLLEELESWRGTPFVSGAGLKGHGADCVRFVEGVLVNIGAIDPVPFPRYTVRGGGERMLDIFLGVMDAIPRMACIWKMSIFAASNEEPKMDKPEVRRGDVFLISTGRALHHLTIVATPPVLWHCLKHVGEGNIFDSTVEQNLRAIYRVKP